jgi:hypothetical protein
VRGVPGVHDAGVLQTVFELLKVPHDLAFVGHFNIISPDVNALNMVENN